MYKLKSLQLYLNQIVLERRSFLRYFLPLGYIGTRSNDLTSKESGYNSWMGHIFSVKFWPSTSVVTVYEKLPCKEVSYTG